MGPDPNRLTRRPTVPHPATPGLFPHPPGPRSATPRASPHPSGRAPAQPRPSSAPYRPALAQPRPSSCPIGPTGAAQLRRTLFPIGPAFAQPRPRSSSPGLDGAPQPRPNLSLDPPGSRPRPASLILLRPDSARPRASFQLSRLGGAHAGRRGQDSAPANPTARPDTASDAPSAGIGSDERRSLAQPARRPAADRRRRAAVRARPWYRPMPRSASPKQAAPVRNYPADPPRPAPNAISRAASR